MKRLGIRLEAPAPSGKPHASAAGFTLVEILATLAATAILIGAVTVAVNAHAALAQRHRDLVIANAYANSKIEALRSAGFLSLTDGTINLTSELPDELQEPRSGSIVISSQSVSVKEVDLTITYNERGAPKTLAYTTYIGELGVAQY